MALNELATATLYVYTIEHPAWEYVTAPQKDAIAALITRGGWQSVGGRRRGFLKCERAGDLVYGYFAQEGTLEVEQYDDYQQRVTPRQSTSFERIVCLLFLDAGVLVAQSVRLAGYADLSGRVIRDGLFQSLELAFRQAGLVFRDEPVFERYQLKYSKQDLVRIFEEHAINRIIVDGLTNAGVPDDLRLFNPDFDADAFLKRVIVGDLRHSDEIDWQGQALQKTKIVRAIVHAGQPRLLVGVDDAGEVREWERAAPESIVLPLNTNAVQFPEEDLQRLLAWVKRKFDMFKERCEALEQRRTSGMTDLPLLGGPGH